MVRTNKILAIFLVLVLSLTLAACKVSYEIVTSLPADAHLEDIERDTVNPVTIAVREEYIAVLPPYGYEVEFIDVIRDGGIIMRYNLIPLDNPNGEAEAFAIKVSNLRKGPIGAACQNLDILSQTQD